MPSEAFLHGFKVASFLPIGTTDKFKVILSHGCLVEHIDIRKNDACPTEEVALARGLLLVAERVAAQDAAMDELSKEGPVDLTPEVVPSRRWEIPERGLEGHDC